MERGRLKLKLNLDTSEEDMVDMDMAVMAVATMERGRLMLNLDTSEEDMAVMDMEEDIMVKCFNYLLAVSPLTNFSLAQHKKIQIKSEPFQKKKKKINPSQKKKKKKKKKS